MKTWNCQYLGNKVTFEVEIWYGDIINDADFDHGIEIRINQQTQSNSMTSSF